MSFSFSFFDCVCELARAMGRAKPDPAVSVGDLVKGFERLCFREGTWDLSKLLLNGSDASYLSGNVGQLCMGLFKTCKNGVFSSKRLKTAIEKLAAEKGTRLNQTKDPDSVFLDRVDTTIRVAAAHLRELRNSGGKYVTCVRKASQAEKKTGSLEKGEPEGFQAVGHESVVDKSPAETAVEPLVAMQQAPRLEQIRHRVLAKKASDASTPDKRLRGKNCCSSSWSPSPVNAPSGHNDRPSLKRQKESLHLDEKKELCGAKGHEEKKKTIQVSEKTICICYCCQAIFRE